MNIKDFLDSKNLQYPALIVSDDLKTFTLADLLNEYAQEYSKNYLCYSQVIEMIDFSDDLKQFEINIDRFFFQNKDKITTRDCVIHNTDLNGICFKCKKQVFTP